MRPFDEADALGTSPARVFGVPYPCGGSPPGQTFLGPVVEVQLLIVGVVIDPVECESDVVVHGGGAVGELGDHDLAGYRAFVVGDELAVVVEEGGVIAGVHGF